MSAVLGIPIILLTVGLFLSMICRDGWSAIQYGIVHISVSKNKFSSSPDDCSFDGAFYLHLSARFLLPSYMCRSAYLFTSPMHIHSRGMDPNPRDLRDTNGVAASWIRYSLISSLVKDTPQRKVRGSGSMLCAWRRYFYLCLQL